MTCRIRLVSKISLLGVRRNLVSRISKQSLWFDCTHIKKEALRPLSCPLQIYALCKDFFAVRLALPCINCILVLCLTLWDRYLAPFGWQRVFCRWNVGSFLLARYSKSHLALRDNSPGSEYLRFGGALLKSLGSLQVLDSDPQCSPESRLLCLGAASCISSLSCFPLPWAQSWQLCLVAASISVYRSGTSVKTDFSSRPRINKIHSWSGSQFTEQGSRDSLGRKEMTTWPWVRSLRRELHG